MKIRIAAVVLFLLLFAGAFGYFKLGIGHVSSKSPAGEFHYDAWLHNQSKDQDSRLNFDKNMTFVYVSEMNTGALRYLGYTELMQPFVSINEETKAAYFYNANVIPRADTGLVVVKDTTSFDTLLDQKVINAATDATVPFDNISFPDIESKAQPVINEERLYLNQPMRITAGQSAGTINVSFDGGQFELQPGETKTFSKKSDRGPESEVLITNFGLWNSQNMKYVLNVSK